MAQYPVELKDPLQPTEIKTGTEIAPVVVKVIVLPATDSPVPPQAIDG